MFIICSAVSLNNELSVISLHGHWELHSSKSASACDSLAPYHLMIRKAASVIPWDFTLCMSPFPAIISSATCTVEFLGSFICGWCAWKDAIETWGTIARGQYA